MIIATKAGHDMWPGPYGEWGSRKNLIASLDQSLRRMGLDYVDIFYSHRPDPRTPVQETMQALVDIVRQGKALYVGISKYPVEMAAEAADCGMTLSQYALRWILRRPEVTSVIVGASSPEQLKTNLGAL